VSKPAKYGHYCLQPLAMVPPVIPPVPRSSPAPLQNTQGMTMNSQQFAALAAGRDGRVAITREILADLETPVSTYLKLARGPYSYLFESVQGGEKWGRYSMIGLPCRTVLRVRGFDVSIETDGTLVESLRCEDPLAFIEDFQKRFNNIELPDLPRFSGGLVGYFGYDTVRYVEPRLRDSTPPDELGVPDILLMVSDEVVVFDNLAGKIILVVHADAGDPDALAQAQTRLDEIESRLHRATPDLPPTHLGGGGVAESAFVSSMGQAGYEAAVERIKAYTQAGDDMQVVPSQRLTLPFPAEAINLYRALRNLNHSPYLILP